MLGTKPMRRLLLGILLIALICLAGGLSILYVMRDRILLREVRLQAERLAPFHVEIGGLRTSLWGPFSVALSDLEFRQEREPPVRIRDLTVTSPLGIAGLYAAYRAGTELPLNVTAVGLKAAAFPPGPPPGGPLPPAAPPPAWPQVLALPAASPVPLHLSVALKNAELRGGPFLLRGLNAKVDSHGSASGFEAELSVSAAASLKGTEAALPVSAHARLLAKTDSVTLTNLTFRAAGLDGTGDGELAGRPPRGRFQLHLAAPELAALPLRAEDKAALGLTAQPTGALDLAISGTIAPDGGTRLTGLLKATSLALPVRAPERTLFAAAAPGAHMDGPVLLDAELPFTLDQPWPQNARTARFTADNAHASFDLGQAAVMVKGQLEKPRGVPLRGQATFSLAPGAEGGGPSLRIPSFEFTFHTLSLSGSANLPEPIGSRLEAGFRLNVSSLSGFPSLVPVLRAAETEGAEVTKAQGQVQATGSVRLEATAPARSAIDLQSFSVRDLRLPISYAGPAVALRGLLTGSAAGGGKYDAGDLNLFRTSGTFDFTALEIAVPGSLAKKRGRKLVVAFDAQGSPSRLAIRKASLAADGLTASLAGRAAFDARRNAHLNLTATGRADLSQLRDYLPKLPVKISGGLLDANLRLGGTWEPAGGIAQSPLTLTGKVGASFGSIELPAPPAGAPPPPETAASGPILPPWPLARHAELAFRLGITEFRRGPLTLGGLSAAGTLKEGAFSANAAVAQAFGGRATLKNLQGSLVTTKLAVRGGAGVDGLDLGQTAAFLNPAYGKIGGGSLKAVATFSVPDVWSERRLTEIAAAGQAVVKSGSLSTASFNGLVNAKLSGIPGLGDKSPVATNGLAADLRTNFQVAGGVVTLQDFDALTPARDEMQLNGTLNLAFDCDLTGTAHLANAPVRDAVRDANSDGQGRLVVPVRFHGNLLAPQVDVASGAIQEMLQRTAAHEVDRRKNAVIDSAKQKAAGALKDAAGGLLDQLKGGK